MKLATSVQILLEFVASIFNDNNSYEHPCCFLFDKIYFEIIWKTKTLFGWWL